MPESDEYSLADVAARFRAAARTQPDWSDPSPGTWEAVAAATGVPAAAPAATGNPPTLGRRAWLIGAAGLGLGAVIGVVGARLADSVLDEVEETVRQAVLTPLEEPDRLLGTAELRRGGSAYSLAVDVPDGVSNPQGYVEVWLINVDGQRMVSVGVFAADAVGRFTIDPALVESGYLIVDLSNELFDDEPRHSGDTIMRGELL